MVTEPTVEPSEASSEAVATSTDTNNDDLARTGAGVLWLITAGVAAVILGAITLMLRRRNAPQE